VGAAEGTSGGHAHNHPDLCLPVCRHHHVLLSLGCVVLCCVVSVLVLLQVAPMLGRARLGQLTPAMMQGACLRGPDLLSLPPCPQAFIDRCASAICPYVCLICSTALTCCWYDMLCGTLCLCGIALAWLSSWRLPWGLVC
jgi:hypothetical protein